jgi:hypothetical protein
MTRLPDLPDAGLERDQAGAAKPKANRGDYRGFTSAPSNAPVVRLTKCVSEQAMQDIGA